MSVNLKNLSIFISYGHDNFSVLAQRLAKDLQGRVKKVWFDKNNIKTFENDWTQKIEEGISDCDIVLALMTKHAYRRPTGVCAKEIIFACNKNKTIRPILVENMEIPLLLCAIQYFDIVDVFDPYTGTLNEIKYLQKFEELITALEQGDIDFTGYLHDMRLYFNPQDNRMEIAVKTENFIGRKWLFERYEEWLQYNKSSIFLLVGGPGSGKSAFISKLAMMRPEIKGVHFCHYNNKESGRLRSLIKTIAYYLLTQLEDYSLYIGNLDVKQLTEKGDIELFDLLIKKPLFDMHTEDDIIAVAIDAIDEMDRNDLKNFADILSENKDAFPSWFKLILTTRNEYDIMQRFEKFKPVVLDVDCEENKGDLISFLKQSPVASQMTENSMMDIIEKSGGIIQYVKFIVEELAENGLTILNSLPLGLHGLYTRNFDRFFSDNDYKSMTEPLEIICASQEPLTIQDLVEISNNKNIVQHTLLVLGSYLKITEGKISFFHKSLKDWLEDTIGNAEYSVDELNGHRAIANWVKYNADFWSQYPYIQKYGFYHLFKIKDFAGICELYESDNVLVQSSFTVFLEDLFLTEGFNGYTESLLNYIKRHCNNDVAVMSKVVKSLCERGNCDIIVHAITDVYYDKVDWIGDYAYFTVLRLKGDWQGIIKSGEDLITRTNDKQVLIEIYDYMGDAYRLTGDHINAFKFYELAIKSVPERYRAEKCFTSIYNYYDLRYVRGYLSEALEKIEYYGNQVKHDPFKYYKVCRLKGNIKYQSGNIPEALSYFKESLQMAKQAKRPYSIAEALYSIAECLVGQDNELSRSYIDQSREISLKIHSEYNIAKTYFAETELYMACGEWIKAIEIGDAGIEKLTAVGYLTGVARIKRNLAQAYFNLGQYEKAIEYAEYSLQRYRSRTSYPIARLKSFLIILSSADKIGKLNEYKLKDKIEDIPNLSEFPNSEDLISEINLYLAK